MLDLKIIEDTNGIGRDVLEQRIRQLVTELNDLRRDRSMRVEALALMARDYVQACEQLTAAQDAGTRLKLRCDELQEQLTQLQAALRVYGTRAPKELAAQRANGTNGARHTGDNTSHGANDLKQR